MLCSPLFGKDSPLKICLKPSWSYHLDLYWIIPSICLTIGLKPWHSKVDVVVRDRSRAERIRFVAWLEPVETGISGFDPSWMSSRMTFSSIPMRWVTSVWWMSSRWITSDRRFAGQMWLCDFGAPLEVCDGSNSVEWVYVNVMDNRILLNLFQGIVVPSDFLAGLSFKPIMHWTWWNTGVCFSTFFNLRNVFSALGTHAFILCL